MSSKWLLQNVSVDTTGDAVKGDGGNKVIQVSATSYGGGTVSLEGRLTPTLNWTTLTYLGSPAEFTEDTILKLDYLANGMDMRAVLYGSTAASNVNVFMVD